MLDRFLDDPIDKYLLEQSNLVGMTSMFSQNAACFALAQRLKQISRDILVVMGGTNSESSMGQEIVKNVEAVGFVFSGPGLKRLSRIPPALSQRRNPEVSPHCWDVLQLKQDRLHHGRYHQAGTCHWHECALNYASFLDTIQRNFPDDEVESTLLFEISRGCWWGQRTHCTFRGLTGLTMNHRAMSPKGASKVITSLFKHAPKVSSLNCVDNIMPKNHLRK